MADVTDPREQLPLVFSAPAEDTASSPFRVTESNGTYRTTRPATAAELIAFSRQLLQARVARGEGFTRVDTTRLYFIHRLGEKLQEVFACAFLDNRHRLIAYEELFFGTIGGCSVHPREVVRQALQHNAAAVVFAHNHPSGVLEPSRADEAITKRLREALTLIDVRVLDHIIVGGGEALSFAEQGLL